jgi:iron complex outermembrane receptor protein
MYRTKTRLLAGAAQIGLGVMLLAGAAHAADTAAPIVVAENNNTIGSAEPTVDTVVVTGVRGRPKTIANSPVPIDIISKAQLIATGKPGLKQALSAVIPSMVTPAQNGGGISASVPPYTVEGLTSDYVLVLVNGKRRHSTALINNLATVGGGSTPVDLDLIPTSAIDHVEYLRSGAAAQYGSDAIAGVINIILKDGTDGGESDTTAGQSYKSTGKVLLENLDWGAPFLGGGIHFSLTAAHNEPAPANNASSGVLYPLVNGQLDPREATGNTNYGSAYGRSTLSNGVDLAYNLSTPIGHGLDFYSFSTLSFRAIKDARGAFRPDDLSSLPQIYPNGFQAYRRVNETDFQVAAGVKGQTLGWQWDASSTYGRDWAWLGAGNTLNASLGPSVGQRAFYMGQQIFDQWTNNLDITRSFNVGFAKPFDVSWGFEHRWEQFAEVAGEPNSYINGGYQIPNDGTPFDNLYHGKFPQAGLQSFTGTTPADASTHNRNNFAGYVDLGTNPITPWYVGLSGRFEHYDDSSGDSATGKFTTRYELLPGLALRGSVNSGFHAPSLAEEWFSTTQNTTISNGANAISAQTKFLSANRPFAQSLGAKPLTPETSVNYSIGATFEPTRHIRLTVDAYQIDISNRIIKTANIPVTSAQATALGFPGLTAVQYFFNGVNTQTRGVDIVAEYEQRLSEELGTIHWSAIYSGNGTAITKVNVPGGFAPLSGEQLVEQTPRYRVALGADWNVNRWTVHFLETLYGRYEEPQAGNATAVTVNEVFTPKWVADLDVGYRFTKNITVAVGANNLFNAYPDRVPDAILAKTANADSVLKSAPGYTLAGYGVPLSGGGEYGTVAPFGLEGGFYYVRLGVKF